MYFFPYVQREWTVFRCPNGHTVARELKGEVRLGDPCVRCRTCGLETRVDAYREWPDLTRDQRRRVVTGHALSVLFSGTALGVALGAGVAITGLLAGLPDDTLIMLGALGFAAGLCIPALRAVAAVRASKERSAPRLDVPSR
jgi:hypothetical protein